jgi:hypothetical protein
MKYASFRRPILRKLHQLVGAMVLKFRTYEVSLCWAKESDYTTPGDDIISFTSQQLQAGNPMGTERL